MTAWDAVANEYNQILRESGFGDEWDDVSGTTLREDVAWRTKAFVDAVDGGDYVEIRVFANDLNEIIVAAMDADYTDVLTDAGPV